MNIYTQTLAAICATCPHHVHSEERPANLPAHGRMAVCEISHGSGDAAGARGRVPIPVRLTMGMCPIGKFERAEFAVGATRRSTSRCGCDQETSDTSKQTEKQEPQTTGRSIVMWPRWAERTTMYQVSRRTKRIVASEGWLAHGTLAWYGVPMPLRWWIMARYGIVRRYAGCGCMVWLKRLAPWLDGPLGLLERVRLQAVAPVCVWWHARMVTIEIPTGTVRVDNPAWQPLPKAWRGSDGKGTVAAWVLAMVLMLAMLCLARAVV